MLEKELPVFLELDIPIPEELQIEYSFAKYDIEGYIPEEMKKTPEQKETIWKFETLACFWQKKQEAFRKMNDRLAEKVEINLFPIILEKSMVTPPNTPEKAKFMLSVTGKRRSKFRHSRLVDYLRLYMKELMLGYMVLKDDDAFYVPNDDNSPLLTDT